MKVLARLALLLLPSTLVQADCGTLTADDTYERLNQILECLDSRIDELGNRIPAEADSEPGSPPPEEKPESDNKDTSSSPVSTGEEVEPNDYVSQAMPVALGASIRGRLKKDDTDYYQFRVPDGFDHKVRIIFRPLNRHLGTGVRVQVYDSAEKVVAEGNEVNGREPVSLAISPESNSAYLVKVGWSLQSGNGVDYELVIRKEQE
jgi:hypothetical protein